MVAEVGTQPHSIVSHVTTSPAMASARGSGSPDKENASTPATRGRVGGSAKRRTPSFVHWQAEPAALGTMVPVGGADESQQPRRNQRMRMTDLCIEGDDVDGKFEALVGKLRIGFQEVYEKIAEVEVRVNTFDNTTMTANRAAAGVRQLEHDLANDVTEKINQHEGRLNVFNNVAEEMKAMREELNRFGPEVVRCIDATDNNLKNLAVMEEQVQKQVMERVQEAVTKLDVQVNHLEVAMQKMRLDNGKIKIHGQRVGQHRHAPGPGVAEHLGAHR